MKKIRRKSLILLSSVTEMQPEQPEAAKSPIISGILRARRHCAGTAQDGICVLFMFRSSALGKILETMY
jgi:hypothetical protein